MKLYPPQIEGTLPAFAYKNGTGEILVPFTMNQTVSYNSIKGFAIRIKTVQSNQLVYSDQIDTLPDITEVTFPIHGDNFYKSYDFIVGQYYKVQIAYVEKETNEIGYYSTIGVIKCTSQPTMYISGLVEGELQSDRGKYTGVYTNPGDLTEKLYTYYFNVYDNKDRLVTTTGELLHNFEEDESILESKDEFELLIGLEDNQTYKIMYGGTTTNGMRVKTNGTYRIVQQSTIPPEIKADITAEMNQDNGYVKINIVGHTNPITLMEEMAIGTFQILRASEIGQYKDWQIIHKFVLYGSQPSLLDIKDFTVEQGKKYKYALQQYNNDTHLVSDKIYSNEVLVNFEDCFLYDGQRQLKIKYNPKISSFKETLLETKTNTLGGQYPFIFRNGKVSYKEFPISGLVSYLMDEENLFLSDEEMGFDTQNYNLTREHTLKPGISTANVDYFEAIRQFNALKSDELLNLYRQRELTTSNEYKIANQRIRSNSLVDYNQAAERIFKLKVLEFLNDGKPKLFRSAAEGNYIVRLMNSSLTPNDQLGRMLHTFSTTATEIQEFSPAVLEELGIITTKENPTKQMRWETITMIQAHKKSKTVEDDWVKINNYVAVSVQCLNMVPGTKVRLVFEDAPLVSEEVVIGITGAYYVNLDRNISSIEIHKDIFQISEQGQITYGFYGKTFNRFDTFSSFNISDIPLIQFIGDNNGVEIKQSLTDTRNKIIKFNLLHFVKRDVENVYRISVQEEGIKYYMNLDASSLDFNQGLRIINLEEEWSDTANLPRYLKRIPSTDPWITNNVSYEMGQDYWYNFDFNEVKYKGIISLRSSIPNQEYVQPLYIYYRTNLETIGHFVQVSPTNDVVFVFNSDSEHIEELKFQITPLYKAQLRKGYLALETFLDLSKEQLDRIGTPITKFDPLKIYRIVNAKISDKEIYLDGQFPSIDKEFSNYSNNITINGSAIDITNTLEYLVTIPEDIETVYVSKGIISDIGVQRRVIEYGIEKNDSYMDLQNKKQDWKKASLLLAYILYGQDMFPAYQREKYPTGTKYNDKTFQQCAIQADEDLQTNLLDSSGAYLLQDYETKLQIIVNKEKQTYYDYIGQLDYDLGELAKGGTI